MDLNDVAADSSTKNELLGAYSGPYVLAATVDAKLLLLLPPAAALQPPECIVREGRLIEVSVIRATVSSCVTGA